MQLDAQPLTEPAERVPFLAGLRYLLSDAFVDFRYAVDLGRRVHKGALGHSEFKRLVRARFLPRREERM